MFSDQSVAIRAITYSDPEPCHWEARASTLPKGVGLLSQSSMVRLWDIGLALGEFAMLKQRTVVAIVEDDSSMLTAMKHLLNAHGLMTLGFASAEEFLASGSEPSVDCLLLDIGLRGMSGVELSRRLKLAGRALPTIFMTALEDEYMHQQALREGVACLHKPFPAAELIDAIEKAVP